MTEKGEVLKLLDANYKFKLFLDITMSKMKIDLMYAELIYFYLKDKNKISDEMSEDLMIIKDEAPSSEITSKILNEMRNLNRKD